MNLLRVATLSSLTVTALLVVAQKEDYVWMIGPTGAGLDFNGCPPTVITNGVSDGFCFEGAVSIADRYSGTLLFYTNGYRVYCADHSVMPNGDPVGISNTMAQNIILERPGTEGRYFIITPDVQAGLAYNMNYPAANGVNVAEVDLTMNNGLGSVVSKFVPIKSPPNCEMLTAVRKEDGSYWLIGHEYGNSNFFVFNVGNDGVSEAPDIHTTGPSIHTPQAGPPSNSNLDAIGCITLSPDGSTLAFTTLYNGITAVARFDISTGSVYDAIAIAIDGGGYGAAFSSDGSKLYLSRKDSSNYLSFSNGALLQLDLSIWDQASIQSSLHVVHTTSQGGFASLKRGPDGKIYVARAGEDGSPQGDLYLGIINEPNQSGSLCDYAHNGVYLNGHRGSWGLNNLWETGNTCESTSGTTEHSIRPAELTVSNSRGRIEVKWSAHMAFNQLSIFGLDGRVVLQDDILPTATSKSVVSDNVTQGGYLVRVCGLSGCLAKRFTLSPPP